MTSSKQRSSSPTATPTITLNPPDIPLSPTDLLCFVTVGTTRFDTLLQAIDQRTFVEVLVHQHGVTKVVIQTGRPSADGYTLQHITQAETLKGLAVELIIFDLRPTIRDLFTHAKVVVSHAGAGSLVEACRARHPITHTPPTIITVINSQLMNNHQTELADAMALEHYVYATTPTLLVQCLKEEVQLGSGIELPPKHPTLFYEILSQDLKPAASASLHHLLLTCVIIAACYDLSWSWMLWPVVVAIMSVVLDAGRALTTRIREFHAPPVQRSFSEPYNIEPLLVRSNLNR